LKIHPLHWGVWPITCEIRVRTVGNLSNVYWSSLICHSQLHSNGLYLQLIMGRSQARSPSRFECKLCRKYTIVKRAVVGVLFCHSNAHCIGFSIDVSYCRVLETQPILK
jgi:hypothetical protein